MARNGFPSMTALLGLLAIAGYQNRDKISEMLGGLTDKGNADRAPGTPPKSGLDGVLAGLGKTIGGAGAGGLLGGGLGELVDQFRKNGESETVDFWVRTGPNQEIAPPRVRKAIGEDTLEDLAEQTGLSKEEILARLSRELPAAVDQYTPGGKLPG